MWGLLGECPKFVPPYTYTPWNSHGLWKVDGWKATFLLRRSIFRDYVAFKEGIHKHSINWRSVKKSHKKQIQAFQLRGFWMKRFKNMGWVRSQVKKDPKKNSNFLKNHQSIETYSLKLTATPEKRPSQKERIAFQPSIFFRCLVSGKVFWRENCTTPADSYHYESIFTYILYSFSKDRGSGANGFLQVVFLIRPLSTVGKSCEVPAIWPSTVPRLRQCSTRSVGDQRITPGEMEASVKFARPLTEKF